ncbi:hypothetical protein [Paenibacillus cremeus]|uniref:Uncharacterized protein n=1 Tax=Paenibacillus cremeus TaxID=2163881 RepID=A0A559K5H6_9BACL|nr:hypothetical protein [Paenibacillus cremeus]TVY07347.1 hypothetical protein FPZ49_24195 [Paenibacillus cremeus]
MEHVSAHAQLNPVVAKKDYARDDKGRFVWQRNSGGKAIGKVLVPRLDENGKQVYDHKFKWTMEELMGLLRDQIIERYVAEVFGHSRPSSTNPYKW